MMHIPKTGGQFDRYDMPDIKPHSHKCSQTAFCMVKNNRDIFPKDDDGPKLNYFSFLISQFKHDTS